MSLKAVFGVNPKCARKFHIRVKTYDVDLKVNIEFDTGKKCVLKNDKPKSYTIPKNASKITITSNNDIVGYGYEVFNGSIITIDEFTSDTIFECNYMFYGFDNLKEVNNINLNWDRIISAYYMCANWKSFNGKLPDNFCTNMICLKDAHGMFEYWKSYNQKLPNNFCSNMICLKDAYLMFNNWFSYSHDLPDTFFPDTSRTKYSSYMFWGWYNCYNTPKYYLPEYLHDYKQKDIDELNELLQTDEVIDYQLMSKLTSKNYCLRLKGNIDHYIVIRNGKIGTLYNNLKQYCYYTERFARSINKNKSIIII